MRTGRKISHGDARKGREAPEYRTWSRMLTRCTNPNDAAYHRYGGRGIVVCSRWATSYEAFLSDMGRRPTPFHSIDRINNDGNYEPGNCRWATKRQQLTNYTRNRYLTLGRRTMTLDAWAEETGVNATTITARLGRGWSEKDALTTPPGSRKPAPRGRDRKTHCTNGHEYTPENSGRDSNGWRFCRTCNRNRTKNHMRAKRASRKPP